MEPVEAVGKTVEEAVESGLSTLGLARSQVEIEVIDEGSKGLFGLVGRRHARVVVRPLANIESKGEAYEGAMGAVESPVRAEEDLGGIDEDDDEWRGGSSFDEDDAKKKREGGLGGGVCPRGGGGGISGRAGGRSCPQSLSSSTRGAE